MLKLQIIVGSTRPGRSADLVVPWVVDRASSHGAFDVELVDLRDWELPMFAEHAGSIGDPADPTYSTPIVRRWNARIAEGDCYLFVTPEYNHGIPGVLKNAIDSVFVSFGFRNKPAATVAYASGIAAGVRAVEQLALNAVEAELVPLRNTVLIPFVKSAFDAGGEPVDPGAEAALRITMDDLAWWADLLAGARRNGQLPPCSVRMAKAINAPTRA